jgi:hypothetical protein
MIVHPPTAILFVTDRDDSSLQPLLSYLQNIDHLKLTIEPQMVKDLSPYDVVVTENTAAFAGDNEQLTKFVHRGGGWLGLVKLSDKPLPQLFITPCRSYSGPSQILWDLRSSYVSFLKIKIIPWQLACQRPFI